METPAMPTSNKPLFVLAILNIVQIIDIFGQDGIPLANGVGNVAFNGDKVVSFGSSFVDTNSGALLLPFPNDGFQAERSIDSQDRPG